MTRLVGVKKAYTIRGQQHGKKACKLAKTLLLKWYNTVMMRSLASVLRLVGICCIVRIYFGSSAALNIAAPSSSVHQCEALHQIPLFADLTTCRLPSASSRTLIDVWFDEAVRDVALNPRPLAAGQSMPIEGSNSSNNGAAADIAGSDEGGRGSPISTISVTAKISKVGENKVGGAKEVVNEMLYDYETATTDDIEEEDDDEVSDEDDEMHSEDEYETLDEE